MANTKEIKDRIKSVRDTQKITNAMYLIASTKMRKAKSELDHTRPYFEAIKGEIKRIFRTSKKDAESRWFYPEDDGHALTGPYACLVVTADKGLAGMYNQNVIREAEKLLKEHPATKLFVVGEYGRQYFAHHGIPVERSFLYTAQNPTMHRAREITDILLDMFERDEVCKNIRGLHGYPQRNVRGGKDRTSAAVPQKGIRGQHHREGGSKTIRVHSVDNRGAGNAGSELRFGIHLQCAGRQLLRRAERANDRDELRQPERGEAAGRAVRAVQPLKTGCDNAGDNRDILRRKGAEEEAGKEEK